MWKKTIFFSMISLMVVSLWGGKHYTGHKFINISKQMIEGRIFYSRFNGNEFYILSKFKKIDPISQYGEVTYIMMDSPKSISGNTEVVGYRIIDGKLMVYGNDGSASRMSLVEVKPDRWILVEEDDVMGNGKRFKLKKGVNVWFLKKPKGYPALEKCKPVDMECFVEAFKFPV